MTKYGNFINDRSVNIYEENYVNYERIKHGVDYWYKNQNV